MVEKKFSHTLDLAQGLGVRLYWPSQGVEPQIQKITDPSGSLASKVKQNDHIVEFNGVSLKLLSKKEFGEVYKKIKASGEKCTVVIRTEVEEEKADDGSDEEVDYSEPDTTELPNTDKKKGPAPPPSGKEARAAVEKEKKKKKKKKKDKDFSDASGSEDGKSKKKKKKKKRKRSRSRSRSREKTRRRSSWSRSPRRGSSFGRGRGGGRRRSPMMGGGGGGGGGFRDGGFSGGGVTARRSSLRDPATSAALDDDLDAYFSGKGPVKEALPERGNMFPSSRRRSPPRRRTATYGRSFSRGSPGREGIFGEGGRGGPIGAMTMNGRGFSRKRSRSRSRRKDRRSWSRKRSRSRSGKKKKAKKEKKKKKTEKKKKKKKSKEDEAEEVEGEVYEDVEEDVPKKAKKKTKKTPLEKAAKEAAESATEPPRKKRKKTDKLPVKLTRVTKSGVVQKWVNDKWEIDLKATKTLKKDKERVAQQTATTPTEEGGDGSSDEMLELPQSGDDKAHAVPIESSSEAEGADAQENDAQENDAQEENAGSSNAPSEDESSEPDRKVVKPKRRRRVVKG